MGVPFPTLKSMVTVFSLLMGNLSPVMLSQSTYLSTETRIAYEVVTPGSSMDCYTQRRLAFADHEVMCTFQVENWTDFPLVSPRLRLIRGTAMTFPTVIAPGKREAFAIRHEQGVDREVIGTVSWALAGTRQRFIIMWSAPFNFYLYSNWMGLGMTRVGLVEVPPGRKWFDQMFNHNDTVNLTFRRKAFDRDLDPVIYRNTEFEAVGVMSNGHKIALNVIIRPSRKYYENLANPILSELEQ